MGGFGFFPVLFGYLKIPPTKHHPNSMCSWIRTRRADYPKRLHQAPCHLRGGKRVPGSAKAPGHQGLTWSSIVLPHGTSASCLNNRICAGCTPPPAPCNAHGAEPCPSTWHKQGDTTDFPHGTGSPGSVEGLWRRNGESSFLRLPPELEQHHCEQSDPLLWSPNKLMVTWTEKFLQNNLAWISSSQLYCLLWPFNSKMMS